MAHYNFEKDLVDGKQAEDEVIQRLKNYFRVEDDNIERSNSIGYDILFKSTGTRFEVKNDLKAAQTGNVAVEYECRGKPSGLAVSEADFWVYKIGDTCVLLRTADLREKIFEEKAYTRFASGGDPGSQTKMYLVRIAIFKRWGVEI